MELSGLEPPTSWSTSLSLTRLLTQRPLAELHEINPARGTVRAARGLWSQLSLCAARVAGAEWFDVARAVGRDEFIGRGDELAAIESLLARSASGLAGLVFEGEPKPDRDHLDESPLVTVVPAQKGGSTEMTVHVEPPESLPDDGVPAWWPMVRSGMHDAVDRLVAAPALERTPAAHRGA